MNVRKAQLQDHQPLSHLFDGYRQFYRKPADLKTAADFIGSRLKNGDSVIFVAEHQGELLGFTQLFPSFSSVSAQRLWILNDLYVAATARAQGVGTALLQAAKDWADETDSKGLILETEVNNIVAQKLYQRLGYQVQDDTIHYFLATNNKP